MFCVEPAIFDDIWPNKFLNFENEFMKFLAKTKIKILVFGQFRTICDLELRKLMSECEILNRVVFWVFWVKNAVKRVKIRFSKVEDKLKTMCRFCHFLEKKNDTCFPNKPLSFLVKNDMSFARVVIVISRGKRHVVFSKRRVVFNSQKNNKIKNSKFIKFLQISFFA